MDGYKPAKNWSVQLIPRAKRKQLVEKRGGLEVGKIDEKIHLEFAWTTIRWHFLL